MPTAILKPKVRGFICITTHPDGCAAHVAEQIAYVEKKGVIHGAPKRVLVIGASTGYGLASRLVAAFGGHADTVGVFFERPCDKGRPATAGWYNTAALDQAARAKGLKSISINGDAFSDDIKRQTLDAVKKELGQVDLVVYSLASPRRVDPKTGEVYKSVLKPVGAPFTAKTVDTDKEQVFEVSIPPAEGDDIAQTVKVMGGEDWALWMQALAAEKLLAHKAVTVAYSYIGPEVTHPIYKNGTIGLAKLDVEKTAQALTAGVLAPLGGRALVCVNKALVTQASSAIPVVPLYISILYKIMKAKGLHEGCIEQMYRLFAERLYTGAPIPTDEAGRIRIDDWEMKPEVQSAVIDVWPTIHTENLRALSDFEGYQSEFLKLFGFGFAGIDYDKETELDRPL